MTREHQSENLKFLISLDKHRQQTFTSGGKRISELLGIEWELPIAVSFNGIVQKVIIAGIENYVKVFELLNFNDCIRQVAYLGVGVEEERCSKRTIVLRHFELADGETEAALLSFNRITIAKP